MSQFGVISRYCQKKARLIAPRLNRPDRLLVIIVDVELMPTLVRPLGLYYRDWALQGEVQDSFGRQFDLLTFGRRLYAAAQTSPGSSTDGCALTASGNRTDDGSDACACPDFLGSVLAA